MKKGTKLLRIVWKPIWRACLPVYRVLLGRQIRKYVADDGVKRFLIIGVQRSGNHAFAHWFCSQLPGRTVFFNDIGSELMPDRKGRVLLYNTKRVGGADNAVFSVEDLDLRCYRQWFGTIEFRCILLLVRDPYNWLASTMAAEWSQNGKNGATEPSPKCEWHRQRLSRIQMCEQYLEQVLCEHDYLKRPFIDVSYNSWAGDPQYRTTLAHRIGIPEGDKGMDTVPNFGGGSSFDRRTRDGQSKSMQVTERWKRFSEKEEYRNLLNPHLKSFSQRYFGFAPF